MEPARPRVLTSIVGLLLVAFFFTSMYSCFFQSGRFIVFPYFLVVHISIHILYAIYIKSKGIILTEMKPVERIIGFRNSPFSLLLAGAITTLSYFYLGILCAVIIFLFFAILRISKDTWEDFMNTRETPKEKKTSK